MTSPSVHIPEYCVFVIASCKKKYFKKNWFYFSHLTLPIITFTEIIKKAIKYRDCHFKVITKQIGYSFLKTKEIERLLCSEILGNNLSQLFCRLITLN